MTLSFLGSQRVVQNYNVMGVAKAALESTVRYLANDLGPSNVRVNAISAGAVKTTSARGIRDFSKMLDGVASISPLRRNTDPAEVACPPRSGGVDHAHRGRGGHLPPAVVDAL